MMSTSTVPWTRSSGCVMSLPSRCEGKIGHGQRAVKTAVLFEVCNRRRESYAERGSGRAIGQEAPYAMTVDARIDRALRRVHPVQFFANPCSRTRVGRRNDLERMTAG